LNRGLLVAVDGHFSDEARRTAQELRHAMITLTTQLPPANALVAAGLQPVVNLH